jgi:perosamine synthetase
LAYVTECVQTGWVSSQGRFVTAFEAAFAERCGARHGIACTSGTTALHLALTAAGVGPGDEVIIPAFTMVASANAVSHLGARPVLVDAEPRTWNLDLDQVAAALGPRTKAVCPVHTYGLPVDMTALATLAERRGLWVIEDAAEAHGATDRGRPTGSLGHLGCFSFYANKIVTTGEGGMVTTDDAELAGLCRTLRDHAFSPERHFWHKLRGYNYRMTNLQAAVGLAQVERFDELVAIRRRNAAWYRRRLEGVRGLVLPPEREGAESVYWMYSVLVTPEFGMDRDDLRAHLAEAGIETRTFFIPMHRQPAYVDDYAGRSFPVAERLCEQGVNLPSGATLTAEDIDRVADAILGAKG